MRYLPQRHYGDISLDSTSAGSKVVTSDVLCSSNEQGQLVGVCVRFDKLSASTQELDGVTVCVFDLAEATDQGSSPDGALLFESASVDNITHSATSAFCNEQFFDTPVPYRAGLRVCVNCTTNTSTANLHAFHVALQVLAGVPG